MTIKIIDLLNKIANGEEVPKKIKCDGVIYNYEFQNTITGAYEYRSQNYNCLMNNMAGHLYLTDILNNKVEIIEEDKDIEELKIEQDGSTYYIKNAHGTKCYLTKHSYLIADKVNELIDEVKKLKGKYK